MVKSILSLITFNFFFLIYCVCLRLSRDKIKTFNFFNFLNLYL